MLRLTLRCIAVLAVGASVSVAVPLPPPVATATAGASTSATPTSAIPLPPDSPAAPTADTAPAPGAPGNTSTEEELTPVIVTAPEPRYVAPTRRDRIGRIWAPVYINGRGPFRLVLDSGATASEITAQVANTLGLTPDMSHRVLLRGVVGSAAVPIVQVQSLTVGDLSFGHLRMPIVPDALGGADGILGTDGMGNRRILIDFNHDRITIARSHDQPAPAGYITIHFDLVRKELLVADAWVGNIRTKAIIDTGGQATIGNLALRAALERRSAQLHPAEATIEDVTRATQQANDDMEAPPIVLGTGFHGSSVQIINDELAFGDMQIFQHWNMTDEPTMLIGMDTLGRLGVLIIDYRRHELQLQLDN